MIRAAVEAVPGRIGVAPAADCDQKVAAAKDAEKKAEEKKEEVKAEEAKGEAAGAAAETKKEEAKAAEAVAEEKKADAEGKPKEKKPETPVEEKAADAKAANKEAAKAVEEKAEGEVKAAAGAPELHPTWREACTYCDWKDGGCNAKSAKLGFNCRQNEEVSALRCGPKLTKSECNAAFPKEA